ncbi:hypothetical protein IWQ52_002303 [Labrenzia sp. EL_159]|nr:hypothetical protein [Labrenzia sp. EL_162]MBG6194789.1 hypothetical protein [Labrenzia sp. EL_159]
MTARKKGGRPPALKADEKTLKQIRGLGQIQATTKECAAVLGVSEPTFLKFKNSNPKVADALEQGKYSGSSTAKRDRGSRRALSAQRSFQGTGLREELSTSAPENKGGLFVTISCNFYHDFPTNDQIRPSLFLMNLRI